MTSHDYHILVKGPHLFFIVFLFLCIPIALVQCSIIIIIIISSSSIDKSSAFFTRMTSSEKFCLKWNDFQDNIANSFRGLREDFDFTDVTLVCEEDIQIEAHKVILSACSPFFSSVLRNNKHTQPMIYMRALKSKDLVAIMDFIYHGQANIFQEDLDSFLALAEELQLKGLTGPKDEYQGSNESPKNISSPQVPKQKKPIPKTENTENTNYQNSLTEEAVYNSSVKSQELVPIIYPKIVSFHSNSDDLQTKIESMMETISDEDFKWRCTMCGKLTKKRQEMTRHIEIHIDGVTHPCNQCGTVSRSNYALNMHIYRTH